MNTFIDFIMGPMVWISVGIFLGGLIFKIVRIIRDVQEKEPYILSYITLFHSLRSMAAWLVPYLPRSARMQPVYYGFSYLFHLLIFLVPLFLASHGVLLDEAFLTHWPVLSDPVSDTLTLFIIALLAFFALRRAFKTEVRFVTDPVDYLLLALVALPFVTGFLAYHQVFAYQWMTIAHVLSGELLLIIIPFSRFSHMVAAPLTRAYTGSEFGYVRHARDW